MAAAGGISDALIVYDTDLTVTARNRAAEVLYGMTADDVLGRPLPSDQAQRGRRGADRDPFVEAMRGWRGRSEHRDADGYEVSTETKCMPLVDADGNDRGWVMVDREVADGRLRPRPRSRGRAGRPPRLGLTMTRTRGSVPLAAGAHDRSHRAHGLRPPPRPPPRTTDSRSSLRTLTSTWGSAASRRQLAHPDATRGRERQEPHRGEEAITGRRSAGRSRAHSAPRRARTRRAPSPPRRTGRRPLCATRMPWSRIARSSLTFDMTVATTVPPVSSPASCIPMAHAASTWSPSTTEPSRCEQRAVGVAVVRHRRRRPAAPARPRTPDAVPATIVDVHAVGLGVERGDFRTEPGKQCGRRDRRGPVRAIDDDAHPVERGERCSREMREIAVPRAFERPHLAGHDRVYRRRIERRLDLVLDRIGQLHPVAREELDPVVLGRVVRGRRSRRRPMRRGPPS